MAKQGQHKHDHDDPRVSRGHNNPSQSMTITTGSYKKPETYEEQARQHKDTDPQAQAAKNAWHEDTNAVDPVTKKDRVGDSNRTGSDSNADTGTRGH